MRAQLLVVQVGGSRMGSAESIQVGASLTTEQHAQRPVAIVVSAMSKVTDLLLDSMRKAEAGDEAGLEADLQILLGRHGACWRGMVPAAAQEAPIARRPALIGAFTRLAEGITVPGGAARQ